MILKEGPISTDNDLHALINDLKSCVVPIQSLKSTDDIINRAMHSTAIHVGERLLQQECLLLPAVNQTFSSFVSEAAHAVNLHVEEKVTARWLLSNLVVYLQHHLSRTKVRKHGTLLYRSNGDLLASLSHLLYKSMHGRSDQQEKPRSIPAAPTCMTLDEINSGVHQQVYSG